MVWHGITNIICYHIMIRLPTLFQLTLALSLIAIVISVESITNRHQLMVCLTTCSQQVSECVKLSNKKCSKSYHTCLQKASDFYRCFNSSKIKELVKITKCIKERCPVVEQIQQDKTQKYHYNRHRTLPTCGPWVKYNRSQHTQILGEAEKYNKCNYFTCKVSKKVIEQRQKQKKNQDVAPQQNTFSHQKTCGKQYGRGRSSVAILSGVCGKKN